MITEAFHHFRGIGPVRRSLLFELGIHSWQDAIECNDVLPKSLRKTVAADADRCLVALEADDIGWFADQLYPADRWRILNRYLDRCSFFDIETTGLEYDDRMTVIACWHRDELHTFVEDENLDDFLDLLDDVELLVSFNGSTFDVPRVLDGFHIPELPCPHFDLRWPCYHKGFTGGLKQVAEELHITRPDDLSDADGSLAVLLWQRWKEHQDQKARQQLIRYCAADVLLLRPVSSFVAGIERDFDETLWDQLPESAALTTSETQHRDRLRMLEGKFGTASPSRLRTRRRA